MRKVTEREAQQWLALAQEYGFVDADGNIALGRYVIEQAPGGLVIRFITPVPAGLYSDKDLVPKTPPIMFDRDGNGHIVLPGRWWQLMFERLSEHESAPPDVRRMAAVAARTVVAKDCLLPPEFETIEFMAPNDSGELVAHEALPPDTRIPILMRPTRR